MNTPHDDAGFERSLLDSARDDAPDQSTAEAWAGFCASMGQLEGALRSEAPQPSAADTMATTAIVVRSRTGLRTALGWLLLGGVGGGLITAAALRASPTLEAWNPWSAAAQVKHVPQVWVNAPLREAAPPPSAAMHEPAPPREQPPIEARQSPAKVVAPARTSLRTATATEPAATVTAAPAAREPSSLSAEVVAIDIARASTRAGMFRRTLRLIEQYHRDFPASALAPDADVVAIEAAEAMHDSAQVGRRAREFLARYPSDPQVGRVESLLQAASVR